MLYNYFCSAILFCTCQIPVKCNNCKDSALSRDWRGFSLCVRLHYTSFLFSYNTIVEIVTSIFQSIITFCCQHPYYVIVMAWHVRAIKYVCSPILNVINLSCECTVSTVAYGNVISLEALCHGVLPIELYM